MKEALRYSFVKLLGKITANVQLEEDEAIFLLEHVFLPVARKLRWRWRQYLGGELGGSGTGLADPVLWEAATTLWSKFNKATEGEAKDEDEPEDGESEAAKHKSALNVWQQALAAALRHVDRAEGEVHARNFLRDCAKQRQSKILGRGTLGKRLEECLRAALSKPQLTSFGGTEHEARLYAPAGCEDWMPKPDLDLDALLRKHPFPKVKGKVSLVEDQELRFPAPQQVCDVLLKVFDQCRCALTWEQIEGLVQNGFKLYVAKPDGGDDEENEDGEKRVRIVPPASEAEPDGTPEPEAVQSARAALLDAIEAEDGCPVEPPPPLPRMGKLGKLFVGFYLWQADKVKGKVAGGGRYTIVEYSRWSGFGHAQEHARLGSSSTFSVGDLIGLPSLASKLKQPTRAFDAWLATQLSSATQAALSSCSGSGSVPASLQKLLTIDLNNCIRQSASIYEQQRFAGVSLRVPTQTLMGKTPHGSDLKRLNRWLIEDAYPLEVSRNLNGLDALVRAHLSHLDEIDRLGVMRELHIRFRHRRPEILADESF